MRNGGDILDLSLLDAHICHEPCFGVVVGVEIRKQVNQGLYVGILTAPRVLGVFGRIHPIWSKVMHFDL